MGKEPKKEQIYVYAKLIHFVVHLKHTTLCFNSTPIKIFLKDAKLKTK